MEPIKIGRWITMENDHFTLYNAFNFESALEIAYTLSEELNYRLLDATIAHNYKWIDKEALKTNEAIS